VIQYLAFLLLYVETYFYSLTTVHIFILIYLGYFFSLFAMSDHVLDEISVFYLQKSEKIRAYADILKTKSNLEFYPTTKYKIVHLCSCESVEIQFLGRRKKFFL
jgi:hypothetical protein